MGAIGWYRTKKSSAIDRSRGSAADHGGDYMSNNHSQADQSKKSTGPRVPQYVLEAQQVIVARFPEHKNFYVINRTGAGWYAEQEPVPAHKYTTLYEENEYLKNELAKYKRLFRAARKVQEVYEKLGGEISKLNQQ
jgi:hypothetical protein